MHLNGKVIRNVKDGRAAEPRKEQICNSSHPDGERAEKLKVRVVFKTVLSKMNKAVADGRTDGRTRVNQNPTSASQVLFVYRRFNYSGFPLLRRCWRVLLGGLFGPGQPRFKDTLT